MNFSTHTATDLINQINGIFSLKEEETVQQIVSVFEKEGIDYHHLISSDGNIHLNSPLKLVHATLFELNILRPPMTSRFFPVVMRLAEFLKVHAKGKELVTFDYILSQLFLSNESVSLITDLNELGNDQVFIGLKSNGEFYPNLQELKSKTNVTSYFIVEKSEQYRGLNSVSFYKNDEVFAHLEL